MYVFNYYDESEAILAQSSIHPKSLRVALVLARNGFQRFLTSAIGSRAADKLTVHTPQSAWILLIGRVLHVCD